MAVRSKSKPKAARAVRRKKQPSLRLRYRHAVISAELAVAARQRMEHDLETLQNDFAVLVEQKHDAVKQAKMLEAEVAQLQQHRAELLRLASTLWAAANITQGLLEHSAPARWVFDKSAQFSDIVGERPL